MLLKFPLQRFLIYLTITLIGTLVLNHFSNAFISNVPSIAPILFPTLTIFLMVFHTMIAVFMVMKYLCDKRRLYLMPIACAFASSALLMLGTLKSYPDWFLCGGVNIANYNDALIFYVFRNILMALLFMTAVILYAFKLREMHTRKIHFFILSGIVIFCACIMELAWLYSSNDPLLSVAFIDNLTFKYTDVWQGIISWILFGLWGITLFTILITTQLRNIFWYSGAFFCACYIFTLFVLMTGQETASYSWYQARLFETISTLFLIFVLFCDVFTLYRQSNAKYHDSYQNSIRDPLTRLYNRSYFYDSFTALLPTIADGQPVSVIVSDLDHFKRINDKYGHLQGDKVIQFVAKVLQDSVRQNDVAARIGGEEFALLLVNTSPEVARTIAERIRLAISQHNAESSHAQLPESITISMGVFTAVDLSVPVEECVRRADEAMYRAKAAGRNRVMVWE
ncbi:MULTISPECIES: sensor domain-containing diguanylate cyclase [Kluyvera]|uniref:sensor domain-containing diguanylate cyclase n=1 Tax=Kluyvera TaxID=579 RepID=UPI001C6FF6ED|nr:GGDEF domain-containing protein [Kluyvera sp. EC_51]MBW9461841.1 GGDEF domain-containing protein [Kluyvera sp. EC_51]